MTKRTMGLLAATLALIGSVAACGDDDDDSSGSATDASGSGAGSAMNPCGSAGAIGVSFPLPQSDFEHIQRTLEQDAEADGREIRVATADLDPNKQLADIDGFIQQGVDAIVIDAVDAGALTPVLARAESAGIPVIFYEPNPDPAVPVDLILRGRAAEAAAAGARYLSENADGPVGAIFSPPAPTLIPRNEAFRSAAEAEGLDIAIQREVPAGNPTAARQATEAIRVEQPDLGGLWAYSDLEAVAAGSVTSDDFTPLVVGINANPEGLDAIRAGRVAATFDIFTGALGHIEYWAASQLACGEELPPEIFVGQEPRLVDASNIDTYRTWDEQLEQPFEVTLEESDGETSVVVSESFVSSG